MLQNIWPESDLVPQMEVAQIWIEKIGFNVGCAVHTVMKLRSELHEQRKSDFGHIFLQCERSLTYVILNQIQAGCFSMRPQSELSFYLLLYLYIVVGSCICSVYCSFVPLTIITKCNQNSSRSQSCVLLSSRSASRYSAGPQGSLPGAV